MLGKTGRTLCNRSKHTVVKEVVQLKLILLIKYMFFKSECKFCLNKIRKIKPSFGFLR